MASVACGRDERARRRSERVGAAGVLAAAALPVVLWHAVIADIARITTSARTSEAVLGWTPWVMMALGVLCAVPVAIDRRRSRGGRFHTAGAGAWTGWGVTLYLLGFGLATQVAQLHSLST
ncbi:hypothetical protein NBH00_16300 [Paraconexibacter antarcticus]|uniref:DUF4190 domain-containing protein n=1 Tax=Paraconexibacter antarcticus TaxID=2949664 RepID=A0ABY5DLZ3_9ACTN|nr:hypothetical protein [Paraconexibacter antarcticus]UTI62915.1 hypothetical protein NBH00_16300 [Paraconexibacter antarcticus]